MKPTFTIQKASIAAGNKYNVWHDGQIWKITSLDVEFKQLTIRIQGRYKVINLSDIGKTDHIIVKPLELLTVEVDGVVPIVELAKLANPDFIEYFDYQEYPMTDDGEMGYYAVRNVVSTTETFNFDSKAFYIQKEYEIGFPMNSIIDQMQMFQKLHSMHFDYGILQDGFGISTEEIKKFK